MTLRVAPYIKFHFDEDLKKELEMMELLDKVHRENEELDRKRAEAAAAASAQGTVPRRKSRRRRRRQGMRIRRRRNTAGRRSFE